MEKLRSHMENWFKKELKSMAKTVKAEINGETIVVKVVPKNPDRNNMQATVTPEDIKNGVARTKLNNIKANI